MIRLHAVLLTLSLITGAVTPLLCELGCLSEATHRVQPCHETTAGAGLSAAAGSCVHAVPDASVAAVKVTLGQELGYTLSDAPPPGRAPSLQTDHASGPRGLTVHLRSVSRSVLRI